MFTAAGNASFCICEWAEGSSTARNSLRPFGDLTSRSPFLLHSLACCCRWLKFYKSPTINKFAFDGVAQPRAFAKHVLEECHEQWQKLIEHQGKNATVSK